MLIKFSDANRFLELDLDEESSGDYCGSLSGQFDNFGFNKFVRIGRFELTSFLHSFKEFYETLDGECRLYDDDLSRCFCLRFIATKSGSVEVKISYSTDDERDMFKAEIEIEQSQLNELYQSAREFCND